MTRSSLLTLMVVGLLAAACTPRTQGEGEEEYVLRSYTVPDGYENDIRLLIRQFGTNAEITPGGKILVKETERAHAGIKALIEDLEKLGPPKSKSQKPTTLTYWLILGRESTAAKQPDEVITRGFPRKGREEVLPALEAINHAQGPLEFALLERVQIVAGDRTSRTHGQYAEIRQRVTRIHDTIVAELEIDPAGSPYLETQLQLEPGKFLVLGQTAFDHSYLRPSPFGDSKVRSLMLFYVIRAEV